ncbi:MAG: hypothetical protein RLZZ298_1842 [Pseudomonadota bacterium]|jgi:hypothetical protein
MATCPPPTYGLLCFAQNSSGSTTQSSGNFLLPEIHLNIWEQVSNKKTNAVNSSLDIGLMLDVNDQTTSIVLIFPAKIDLATVADLSTVVSQPQAVPAIFNESWAVTSIGTQGKDTVVYDPSGRSKSFSIVSVEGAISETTHTGHDALSISIQPLIQRGKMVANSTGHPIERVYIRFRLLEFKQDFYCVGSRQDTEKWWQPSWQRTEDIDFRINVRRGAPAGLEGTIGHFLDFSKVHLFLMRSRDKDIIFHDKLFKASRSLEDEEFWAKYSIYGTQMTPEASLKRVQNSLGYHWKSSCTEPVKEFGTLARFKIVEFGVGKFVAVALIVGAMGNMLWDGLKTGHAWLFPSAATEALSTTNCDFEEIKVSLPALSAEQRKHAGKVVNQATLKRGDK